jgi:hypothetical protein
LIKFFCKKIFSKNSWKITTIAHNIKRCLSFFSFIFWVLPYLAKYTYMDDHHLKNIAIFLKIIA